MSENRKTGATANKGTPTGSWNNTDPGRPQWSKDTITVGEFEYQKADGTYSYTILKGLNPDGEKTFRAQRNNNIPFGDRITADDKKDYWPNLGDQKPVLYCLPKLIAEARKNKWRVLILEGEKDTDTADAMGFIATTNPFGAGKWLEEFSPYLKGADIVLIIDADQRGREHARQVIASVRKYANSITAFEMPHGFKDLSEWKEGQVKKGLSLAAITLELETMISDHFGNATGTGSPLMSEKQFIDGFVPPDYLIKNLLLTASIYSFTASTGTGKTAVMMRIAFHVAIGLALAGRKVKKGRVLYFAGENPDDIRMRWIKLREVMGIGDGEQLDVHFLDGAKPIFTAEFKKDLDAYIELVGEILLIVIDTSAAYFTGDDENSNTQAKNHAMAMREFTKVKGKPTVVVNCHPTKNPDMTNLLPKGGGNFINEVDGGLVGIGDHGTKLIEISTHGKWRGPDFAPFSFRIRPVTSEKLKDSEGDYIWTVYAEPIGEAEKADIEEASINRKRELLLVIARYPKSSLKDMTEKLGWTTKTGEPNRSLVNRLVDKLEKEKKIKKDDGKPTITPNGQKALEESSLDGNSEEGDF